VLFRSVFAGLQHTLKAIDGDGSRGRGRVGGIVGGIVGVLAVLTAGVTLHGWICMGVLVPNAHVKELSAGPFCWALDLCDKGSAVRLARMPPA
jgi:hypothetical protein